MSDNRDIGVMRDWRIDLNMEIKLSRLFCARDQREVKLEETDGQNLEIATADKSWNGGFHYQLANAILKFLSPSFLGS